MASPELWFRFWFSWFQVWKLQRLTKGRRCSCKPPNRFRPKSNKELQSQTWVTCLCFVKRCFSTHAKEITRGLQIWQVGWVCNFQNTGTIWAIPLGTTHIAAKALEESYTLSSLYEVSFSPFRIVPCGHAAWRHSEHYIRKLSSPGPGREAENCSSIV